MSDKPNEPGARPAIALAGLPGSVPSELAREAANQIDEGASPAAIERRIAELQDEHRALDALIEKLVAMANVNEFELRRLKKRKLKVKDSIILLQLQLEPDTLA
jgi:hypothetical protein